MKKGNEALKSSQEDQSSPVSTLASLEVFSTVIKSLENLLENDTPSFSHSDDETSKSESSSEVSRLREVISSHKSQIDDLHATKTTLPDVTQIDPNEQFSPDMFAENLVLKVQLAITSSHSRNNNS